jgi:hypothetical protein
LQFPTIDVEDKAEAKCLRLLRRRSCRNDFLPKSAAAATAETVIADNFADRKLKC